MSSYDIIAGHNSLYDEINHNDNSACNFDNTNCRNVPSRVENNNDITLLLLSLEDGLRVSAPDDTL